MSRRSHGYEMQRMLDAATVAHAGHWAVNVLYVAPALVTALALAILARGGRRGDGR